MIINKGYWNFERLVWLPGIFVFSEYNINFRNQGWNVHKKIVILTDEFLICCPFIESCYDAIYLLGIFELVQGIAGEVFCLINFPSGGLFIKFHDSGIFPQTILFSISRLFQFLLSYFLFCPLLFHFVLLLTVIYLFFISFYILSITNCPNSSLNFINL